MSVSVGHLGCLRNLLKCRLFSLKVFGATKVAGYSTLAEAQNSQTLSDPSKDENCKFIIVVVVAFLIIVLTSVSFDSFHIR